MKALIHLDQNGKKVMERRVHDAVMKERADISTRAQYVWALSMLQCGLPPCTVHRAPCSAFRITLRQCWTSTWNTRLRT